GAVTWQLVQHEPELVRGVVSVAGAYPANVAPRSEVLEDDGDVARIRFADTGVELTVDRRVMNLYGDAYVYEQGLATSTRFPREHVDRLRAGLVGLPPPCRCRGPGGLEGFPVSTTPPAFPARPFARR